MHGFVSHNDGTLLSLTQDVVKDSRLDFLSNILKLYIYIYIYLY